MSIVKSALGKTTVQALIALAMTGAFVYGFVTGVVTGDQFAVQFALVLGFFFAKTQSS